MITFNDAHSCSRQVAQRRTAIVTLETIVWLPVLAILLAAVIEMGLLLTGSMHVAAASRLGAKLAAEDFRMTDMTMTQDVVDDVEVAVNNYLENAGYGTGAAAGVRLQYNTIGNGSTASSVVSTGGTCPEVNTPAMPLLNNLTGDADDDYPRSVRVVVCVAATDLSPNLLKSFGFDISTTTVELFTTYAYEYLP